MDDVEADFLVFMRIKDPWSLPVDEFLAKSMRLFYYQGVLQGRAAEEDDQQMDQAGTRYTPSDAPTITSSGVDMRHNAAAAKSAAKGLKEGDSGEVSVVPATQWMALAPPGTVEHSTATG